MVPYAIVLPLAIAGARWPCVAGPSADRALWLLAASAVLVCLVFFPQERFRLPVIDPALVVVASVWVRATRSPRVR